MPTADGITPRHMVLLFVDGIGLGSADPGVNPLHPDGLEVLGVLDRLALQGEWSEPGFAARAVDATLDVAGLPQSGTGQTAILTGINAAQLIGRHLNGFPNRVLRRVLANDSIFSRLARIGRLANFANAFTPDFFTVLPRRRLSATSWAALSGGRPLASIHDLRHRRAVYQDFTNLHLQTRGYDVPLRRPEEAGEILAGLAPRQDFLLYEYFLTDMAGHAGDMEFARLVVRALDRFLAGFLARVDRERTMVILISDHGNLEDMRVRHHTRNPVPLLVWGPKAERLAMEISRIDALTPAILNWFRAVPSSG